MDVNRTMALRLAAAWLMAAAAPLAAAHAGSPPADAKAAPAAELRTEAFVGALLSLDPLPDPCAPTPQAPELRCISMDTLYRARYRVVTPVQGVAAGDEVSVGIADHYGTPRFAHAPHALLFVAVGDGQRWLHKYQGIAMYRTADGDWASCGALRSDAGAPQARALRYGAPVAVLPAGTTDWRAWLRQSQPQLSADDLRRVSGALHCTRGVRLAEVERYVREQVLAARGVVLPP